MTSGTAGWKTRPSTMPTTSAAIPIMPGLPSAFLRGRCVWRGVVSMGPNLFGELDIPDRSGGQRQAVGDVHGDDDTVRGLQQPKALQAGAVVEDVLHRVRRPDRQDLVGAAGGAVVDEDRRALLPDGDVGSDPDSADGDRFGAAGPQRVDDQLEVAVKDDLSASVDALFGHVGKVRAG